MQIYSILGVVVGLLSLSYKSVLSSQPALTSVKVKFNGTAVLSCSERCSGVAGWTDSRERSDTLAECDQTSCRSVKEGYQMIHDQYLKGDLSLTITEADFSKRKWYTCSCDGTDLCDVSLRLEPREFSQQLKPGDSLTLDFPVSEPVKVTFNKTGDANPVPVMVCEVEGRKVPRDSAYEKRVVFSLQLKKLKASDSGVYTLEDTKNKEVVSTYRITVEGEKKGSWLGNVWEKDELYIGFGVGLAIGALLGFFVPPQIMRIYCWLKRRVQRFGGDGNSAAAEDKSQPSAPERLPLKEPSSD